MKRRLPGIAGLLGLGMVINIAVAWTTALTMDVGRGALSELYAPLDDEHHWEVFRWDTVVATRVLSRCWRGAAPGPYNHGEPASLLAGWGHIGPPDPRAPQVTSQIDEAWGLPLRSMACRFEARRQADGTRAKTTGFLIRLKSPPTLGRRSYYLPLQPLWPGLVANTVVYALALVVLHAAARDVTRAIRRRRHGLGVAESASPPPPTVPV